MKNLITICLILITAINSQAQEKEVCDCPLPSEDQIIGFCDAVYNKQSGTEGSEFAFKFEEYLWEFSCAKPTKDVFSNAQALTAAHKKIQIMWKNNRKIFQCKGFPLPEANIVNFSLNAGFPGFLRAAVKIYKLDLNFVDEKQQTVMDYILPLIASYRAANMTAKVAEYERIYKVLADGGAKHAKDL